MITIWTEAYRPFIMGGDPHAPIATKVEPSSDLHELPKGICVYEVLTPWGETLVVEARSGGIVGSSLQQVEQDAKNTDRETLEKSITQAISRSKKCDHMTADRFWKLYKTAADDNLTSV